MLTFYVFEISVLLMNLTDREDLIKDKLIIIVTYHMFLEYINYTKSMGFMCFINTCTHKILLMVFF